MSAGSGSAPTWSSNLTTTKIRAANYALGNVFANTYISMTLHGSGSTTVRAFYTNYQ